MTPPQDQQDLERQVRTEALEALARKFKKFAKRIRDGKTAQLADDVNAAIELYRGLNLQASKTTLDRMSKLAKLLSDKKADRIELQDQIDRIAEHLMTVATAQVDADLIGNITQLPVAEICPGDNDRTVFDDDKLQKLAESIKTDGLIQPISVRYLVPPRGQIKYQIVAGERRFRAVRDILKWETIPAIVREMTDEQAAAWMLSENVHREDIDPIDEANAYDKRMKNFGWTVNQVAEKANVNAKRVSARLALLNLLPEMQQRIRKELIPIAFGELMAPLDTNRQRIAFKYIAESKHPFLREFKVLVGKLLADQAQDAMFDLTTFDAQSLIESAKSEGVSEKVAEYDSKPKFPMANSLPPLLRVGSIGESLHTYLLALNQSSNSEHREAAKTIGFVYDAMIRQGLCFPPHRNKMAGLAENARLQASQWGSAPQ